MSYRFQIFHSYAFCIGSAKISQMVDGSRSSQETDASVKASGSSRHFLFYYGLPILATCAATLLRLALAPLVGSAVPFVTYFAATVILAWYRGFWSAAIN